MTLPYQDNLMPHVLALACPQCSHEAVFDFMECVKIRLKKDIAYFQKSKVFEHRKTRNHDGHGINLACYFHKLDYHSLPDIADLPQGYAITDWAHSNYVYRTYGLGEGTVVCTQCGLRRKHKLNWPDEAYYKINVKQHSLWAFNRQSAIDLRDYIQSEDRDRSVYKSRHFLLKVPSHFQAKNLRDLIVKRFTAKLSA